jgi:hypothetical protein
LNREALDAKERQFAEALENQRRLHREEIESLSHFRDNAGMMNDIIQNLNNSTMKLHSIQLQVDSDHAKIVQEKEKNLQARQERTELPILIILQYFES